MFYTGHEPNSKSVAGCQRRPGAKTAPLSWLLVTPLLWMPLALISPASAQSAADPAMEKAQPQGIEDRRQQLQGRGLGSAVYNRLAKSASLDGSAFEVVVDGGQLTLRGYVADEQKRDRALWIARSTPGVRKVIDELVLDAAAVTARQDREANDGILAERTSRKLAEELFEDAAARARWSYGWQVEGPNWQFMVEVDEGVATLTGTVPTLGDIHRAIRETRELRGIRAVTSVLKVASRNRLVVDFDPYEYDPYDYRVFDIMLNNPDLLGPYFDDQYWQGPQYRPSGFDPRRYHTPLTDDDPPGQP